VQATIYNLAGKEVETIDLDDTIFGITPNHAVIHQAVLRQQANARQGTHDTKTRADVSGGGKKPWRQKGTGRARQGSTRSPQWRHGGIAFGPHPRSYEQDMPRKARRLAIRSVLSGKLADGQLLIVDGFGDLEPRTRAMLEALKALNINDSSTLIFTTGTETEVNLKLAAGNLPRVKMVNAQFLSVVDMLKHDFVIMPREAVEVVTGILGNTGGRRKLVLRVKGTTNGRAKAPAATATATATKAAPTHSKKPAATAEAAAENVAFEPTGEVAEVAAATEVETPAKPKAAARPKAEAATKAAPRAKKTDDTAVPKKAAAKKTTTGKSAADKKSEG
jgi:large subunit ribosomal protein L4